MHSATYTHARTSPAAPLPRCSAASLLPPAASLLAASKFAARCFAAPLLRCSSSPRRARRRIMGHHRRRCRCHTPASPAPCPCYARHSLSFVSPSPPCSAFVAVSRPWSRRWPLISLCAAVRPLRQSSSFCCRTDQVRTTCRCPPPTCPCARACTLPRVLDSKEAPKNICSMLRARTLVLDVEFDRSARCCCTSLVSIVVAGRIQQSLSLCLHRASSRPAETRRAVACARLSLASLSVRKSSLSFVRSSRETGRAPAARACDATMPGGEQRRQ